MQYVFLPRCLLHQNHHHQTAVSAPYSMPQTMLYCPKYKKNIKISLWLIILLQYFGNIRLVWKELVGKKAPLRKHWKTRRHWQLKASQESIQWNLFYWTANTLSTLIQELLGGSITIHRCIGMTSKSFLQNCTTKYCSFIFHSRVHFSSTDIQYTCWESLFFTSCHHYLTRMLKQCLCSKHTCSLH